jgi:hypothetical protein
MPTCLSPGLHTADGRSASTPPGSRWAAGSGAVPAGEGAATAQQRRPAAGTVPVPTDPAGGVGPPAVPGPGRRPGPDADADPPPSGRPPRQPQAGPVAWSPPLATDGAAAPGTPACGPSPRERRPARTGTLRTTPAVVPVLTGIAYSG